MRHNYAFRSVGNMNHEISEDRLRRDVPSIFAASPFHTTSEKYQFIPTIEVVHMLRDRGFVPVKAQQSLSRIPGKTDFTKHLIRFRSLDDVDRVARRVGDEFFEIALLNGHDGSSVFNFQAGVFRLVCLNGMLATTSDLGSVKVRHIGKGDLHQKVIDTTYEVLEQAPKVMAKVAEWKQIELKPQVQLAFASAAAELIENKVAPQQLLTVNRSEDRKPDLWTTVNRVQENIIKGGVPSVSGRKRSAVRSVGEDVRLNTAIWKLAEEMQRLTA